MGADPLSARAHGSVKPRRELEPGAMIADKYRLGAMLARGGMGSVWAAHDVTLRRPVAIKFMAASIASDPDFRRRFEVEARAAAQLRTAHVVQIFDFGIDHAVPYIAMELLEGEDLQERLERVKRFRLDEALQLVTQMAKALRLAHEGGIIHRDLKPRNVYLARTGDDEEIVKLLDFGVAKLQTSLGPTTLSGVMLGSPAYMSPEQVRSETLDHRSDLFSLGSVLFRMITGKKPFEGDLIDVFRAVTLEPAPAPSSIAPDLPRELDAFFARALAKDRDQRFGSAREMVAEFRLLVEATRAPDRSTLDARGTAPEILALPTAPAPAANALPAPPLPSPPTAVAPEPAISPAPEDDTTTVPRVEATAATADGTVTLVRPDPPAASGPGRLAPSTGTLLGAAALGVALVGVATAVLLAARAPAKEETATAVAPAALVEGESEAARASPEPPAATGAPPPRAAAARVAATAGAAVASAAATGAPRPVGTPPSVAGPASRSGPAPRPTAAPAAKAAKAGPDFGY